jgi:hypothetical protein
MDCSRVPHDLQTGEQFNKARRAAGGDHADALAPVGGGVLRPVFRELILCCAFIIHAGRLAASKTEGKSGRRVATWTCVQLRRAVSKRENNLRSERYGDQCDPEGESGHDDPPFAVAAGEILRRGILRQLMRPRGCSRRALPASRQSICVASWSPFF